MVDLEGFAVSGGFGSLSAGVGHATVVEMHGQPDLLESERKSRPLVLVYDDGEFRFRSDRLTAISERNVHLGCFQGALQRIGVGYPSGVSGRGGR